MSRKYFIIQTKWDYAKKICYRVRKIICILANIDELDIDENGIY